MVIEPYMTLFYSIKYGDISLLRHAIRKNTVIFQAPVVKKPKYARVIIRQVHIFDTKASNPQLQESYLANVLINLRKLPHTFYKINLLLEHQNGEFQRFRADRGSFLQETDEIFWLYTLSVNPLCKVRLRMNKIIVGCNHIGISMSLP